MKGYQNEETLRKMYHDNKMTLKEIAEHFDVSHTTIRNWMVKNGIERRGRNGDTKLLSLHYRGGGYLGWYVENETVYAHRLLAVAEYGFDAIADKEVHHKNNIPFDNRAKNIELLEPEKHRKKHHERGDITYKQKYTNDELLNWIAAFVEEFGVVPCGVDFREGPTPSVSTYQERFGGFENAVRAAGYTPRGEKNKTKAD